MGYQLHVPAALPIRYDAEGCTVHLDAVTNKDKKFWEELIVYFPSI
jgi:hypothetical protein